MKVPRVKTHILEYNKKNVEICAKEILKGNIIAFPTETVYGLGANALDYGAVNKIFLAKGRPNNNPLIVHISKMEMLEQLCHINKKAMPLIDKFWPGPLTLIFKKKNIIPSNVNCNMESIAIRMPSNKIALDLINESNCPIAAPSANSSGKPSPTKAEHVYEDLKGKIEYIIDGGQSDIGLESTVIDVSNDVFKILRPGKISYEDINKIYPNVSLSEYILKPIEQGIQAESPGMMYKHYSPVANLILFKGNDKNKLIETILIKLNDDKQRSEKSIVLCFEEDIIHFKKYNYYSMGSYYNLDDYANKMFDVLRYADKNSYSKIYAFIPNSNDIGLAILNRMYRASGFNIIEV